MTAVDLNDKISFILYGSYEEQLNMLTDEQAGKLIKSVYTYVRTGEKQQSDPMVNLLLSVVCHQLDIDARKYAESKERRREAGKKGGRPRKNNPSEEECVGDGEETSPANKMTDNQKPEKAMLFLEKQTKDIKPVDVYVDVDGDVDVDEINRYSRHRRLGEGDTAIFPYGADAVPTTQAELRQAVALANQLVTKHLGRTATDYDIERVFGYVYRPAYTADDEAYAAFDQPRADLLTFVFDRAAEQNHMTWKYIDGIMDNYRKRGVSTVADTIQNEYAWNRGEILR